MFTYSRSLLAAPDTSVTDYVLAEQGTQRLRDGFAEYFRHYDALLLPVTTIPAHSHGLTQFTLDGRTVDAFHVMSTTVPFNLTGLPALSMRFGTSGDGMPIGVQLATSWHAESTILHIASLLESLSPVRDQHPALLRQTRRISRRPHAPAVTLREAAAEPLRFCGRAWATWPAGPAAVRRLWRVLHDPGKGVRWPGMRDVI